MRFVLIEKRCHHKIFTAICSFKETSKQKRRYFLNEAVILRNDNKNRFHALLSDAFETPLNASSHEEKNSNIALIEFHTSKIVWNGIWITFDVSAERSGKIDKRERERKFIGYWMICWTLTGYDRSLLSAYWKWFSIWICL